MVDDHYPLSILYEHAHTVMARSRRGASQLSADSVARLLKRGAAHVSYGSKAFAVVMGSKLGNPQQLF